jgi:hypothetical protein
VSEEGVDPEHPVDETDGSAQLGSRFPGWRGNRMKTSENENGRLTRAAEKFARQCIQIGGFRLEIAW